MPRGAQPKIRSIPDDVLEPYLAGVIGYREVARRLGKPRNTVLRTLVRLGHATARVTVDCQGKAVRERWKPVPLPEYADFYDVSDRGRVRRSAPANGTRPGKVLSPAPNAGHPFVMLCVNYRRRGVAVAPLVAGAFLPPRPSARHVVGRKNGVSGDCRAANLFWTTQGEIGRRVLPNATLTPAQVDEIRELEGKLSGPKVAARYGVSPVAIYCIWNDTTWKRPC